jgi:hypothetical protein
MTEPQTTEGLSIPDALMDSNELKVITSKVAEDWLEMCERMSFGQNKIITAYSRHERYQQSRIRALRELVRLGYREGE